MSSLTEFVKNYESKIDDTIQSFLKENSSSYLSEPINYILQNGGKKIRPILVLLTTDITNGDMNEALKAAASIELFHIFSLVHDDIMDKDEFRRGKQTIHKKWDESVAILSGDGLLAISNIIMNEVKTDYFRDLMKMYSKTFYDVCEGQAFDKEFERRDNVHIDEYINMIGLKTSALLGASCYIGALLGLKDPIKAQEFYQFGYNLGLAFQIQDDILDLFAEQDVLGKDVASDVYMDKKSILTLYAKQAKLNYAHLIQKKSPENIEIIKDLFRTNNILTQSIELKDKYSDLAHSFVEALDESNGKHIIAELVQKLNNRIS